MNIDRCCNCSDGPVDWPCNEDSPTCLRVSIEGMLKSACEFPAEYGCMHVPDAPTTFFDSIDRTHSVEGINGMHVVRNNSECFYCSVKGEFEDGGGTVWVGIIFERFCVNISLTCLDASSNPLPAWHVSAVTITTENGGGAGCNDGTIFQWSAAPDPVPFGTVISNNLIQDCSTNPYIDANAATVTIEAIECDGSLPYTTYFAENCDDPDDIITVDIAARPDNHQYCFYSSVKYRLTGTRSGATPVTVTWEDESCPLPEWPLCYRCDGDPGTITIDPATIAPGTQTVRYDSVIYYISSKLSTQTPVTVESLTDPCPTAPYKIGRRCGDNIEISFDPATRPPGGQTFFFEGFRYFGTNIPTTEPPEDVTWSPLGCGGIPGQPQHPCEDPACHPGSIAWPECCDLPAYSDCPFCGVEFEQMVRTNPSLLTVMKGKAAGKIKKTKPRRRGKFGSDAELDEMGYSPGQQEKQLKRGGCCDPPLE